MSQHTIHEFRRILASVCLREFDGFIDRDFHRDMRTAVEALRQRKVLLRPCGMFPGLTHGHVRLCVRTEGENRRLTAALGGPKDD